MADNLILERSFSFGDNPFPVFEDSKTPERMICQQLKNLKNVVTKFNWTDDKIYDEQTVRLEHDTANLMNFFTGDDHQPGALSTREVYFVKFNRKQLDFENFSELKGKLEVRINFVLRNIQINNRHGAENLFYQKIQVALFICNVQKYFLGLWFEGNEIFSQKDDPGGVPLARRARYEGRINRNLEKQIQRQNEYAQELFEYKTNFKNLVETPELSGSVFSYVAGCCGIWDDNKVQEMKEGLKDLYNYSNGQIENNVFKNSKFWFFFSPVACYYAQNRLHNVREVLLSFYAISWIWNKQNMPRANFLILARNQYRENFNARVLPFFQENWEPKARMRGYNVD